MVSPNPPNSIETGNTHLERTDKSFMAEPQITEDETLHASESVDAAVESVSEDAVPVAEAVIPSEEEVAKEQAAEAAKEVDDKGLAEVDEEGTEDISLGHVIESLAFATEDPISLKKVAKIYAEALSVRMPTEKKVRAAIDKLNEQYAANGRSFRIKEWAGGIRMASHPQYAQFIRALYKDNRPKKLSRTLMETLAIIAYSQPTTKPEIDFVRGVDSDYAVRKLLELGLIDIVGRSDSIGRPLLYGTSERFLEQFGLSQIEALPKLREVEDLLGDPAFKKERLQLLALEEMESGVNKGEEESGEKESEEAKASGEQDQAASSEPQDASATSSDAQNGPTD